MIQKPAVSLAAVAGQRQAVPDLGDQDKVGARCAEIRCTQ
jgi:hypothetical protein